MMDPLTTSRIDRMRSDARQIVRELGFMQKGLAGTDLSPSAVHTLIEVGLGTVTHATDLSALLHLEKSSVSRLLQKLQSRGLIAVGPGAADRRVSVLSLTAEGRALVREIERFARRQLRDALGSQPPGTIAQIEAGLGLFARALGQGDAPELSVHEGYRPGVIGAVTALHAAYYAAHYGFGAVFERKVAREMAEFMGRIESPQNITFSAYLGEDLVGSVSIDGEDLGPGVGHLRWFIVSEHAQGLGIGAQLLARAVAFADRQGFGETRLWTFRGLDAARRLYERQGFSLVREEAGSQWGTPVTEQAFSRKAQRA